MEMKTGIKLQSILRSNDFSMAAYSAASVGTAAMGSGTTAMARLKMVVCHEKLHRNSLPRFRHDKSEASEGEQLKPYFVYDVKIRERCVF